MVDQAYKVRFAEDLLYRASKIIPLGHDKPDSVNQCQLVRQRACLLVRQALDTQLHLVYLRDR